MRRAFTLIELLVVILIIALLVGISIAVGRTVVGGGKVSQTENVIRVLDTMLNDYTSREGRIPDPFVEDPHVPGNYFPVIDGRNMQIDEQNTTNPGFQMVNSVGLFQFQVGQSSAAIEALEGLDARFRRLYTPYSEQNAELDNVVHEIPTVFDAWGNPVRYVHPAWDGLVVGPDLENPQDPPKPGLGTQQVAPQLDVRLPSGTQWAITEIRRNNQRTEPSPTLAQDLADSDGGTSANQRPYFYSAGPDGLVGFDDVDGDGKLSPGDTDWNADNVYTIRPLFRD